MFSFFLLDGRLVFEVRISDFFFFFFLQITSEVVYIPGLYPGISFKVDYVHLRCLPGDSDFDGPEILALRVSPVEDWRESVAI